MVYSVFPKSLSTRRGLLKSAAQLGTSAFTITTTGYLGTAVSALGAAEVREIYVSPGGDDTTGTGAIGTPYQTIGRAASAALPGDTIYLRPGRYQPFQVLHSGKEQAPITFTTLPGEEHLAVIDGQLGQVNSTTEHGIYIVAKNHINISNLVIEDSFESGIWVIGSRPTVTGHHAFTNNIIRRTGGPGISIQGYLSSEHLPIGTVWTSDILIEFNDISQTNMITPYKSSGGVNECITVAGGVRNVVTRFNDIHDSLTYGIDYKHGFVGGGEIYGNHIWNVENYGIYLDTNRLEVHDVKIYDNMIWRCNVGIVMNREANNRTNPPAESELQQSFRDIIIFNNVIWDMNISGIYAGAHPNDGPYGEIHNVQIMFNTVYNCGVTAPGQELRLTSWSSEDYLAAGVVRDFKVVGNLAFRPGHGKAWVEDQFSGKPGFTVAHNVWNTDPGFIEPDISVADLTGALPNFKLIPNSPAAAIVPAEYVLPPYDQNISGAKRGTPANAGAY